MLPEANESLETAPFFSLQKHAKMLYNSDDFTVTLCIDEAVGPGSPRTCQEPRCTFVTGTVSLTIAQRSFFPILGRNRNNGACRESRKSGRWSKIKVNSFQRPGRGRGCAFVQVWLVAAWSHPEPSGLASEGSGPWMQWLWRLSLLRLLG